MAVNFKQLSVWKAGGRPTNARWHGGLSGISCGIPGLFGNRGSALLFGGKSPNQTCTEEYNGETNVWASSNALPLPATQAMGGGSTNAGRATGFHIGTLSTTNRSLGEGTCSVTNPHDSGTVTALAADTFTEWDGTSWGTLKASAVDSSDTVKTAGAWQAGAGTGNSAVFFGGHRSNSQVEADAWAECSKEWNGSVFTANAPLAQGRGELTGAGGQNAALAMGGSNRARYWNASGATNRFCNSSNRNAEISVNNPYSNTGTATGTTPSGGQPMMDPVPPSKNITLIASYSCMEEYNGTSWSSNSQLLNPRIHGGAAGSSNDAVIFNGWWGVSCDAGTGGSYPGPSYRFNATYLCCRLTTDHWNGSAWSVDAIDLPSSYSPGACGGRDGARGDGEASSTAISVDGIMTWNWQSKFNGHPNGFFSELLLSGINYFSDNWDEGVSSNTWQGPLTREFTHSKNAGVNFGPKVPNQQLSLYYDTGNYKNYFTNEHCKPLTNDCVEVQIGKMGSYLCQNDEGGAGTAAMQTVAEDGEFCGWTVGGPYALGMPRSYGVASGATNSALYYGGWNSPNQFNNFCTDVWKYDGNSWSNHDAPLLVGACMGTATGKNENDSILIDVPMLSRATQAMIDVYECADASKDQSGISNYQNGRALTQQLEGLTWTRGGDLPGEGTGCSQGMTGHVNSALWHDYNTRPNGGAQYDGSVWTSNTSANACHQYGAMSGKSNDALLIGGTKSFGRCTDLGTDASGPLPADRRFDGVESWDGSAWAQVDHLVSDSSTSDSMAAAGGSSDAAIAWYRCETQEYDGLAWKMSCHMVAYCAPSQGRNSGFLKSCPTIDTAAGAKSTNTSHASALAFDVRTCALDTPYYNSGPYDTGASSGTNEWTKTSLREMKSSGDKLFHMNHFQSASLRPSGSAGVLKFDGTIDTTVADKNIYIQLTSGSLSSDVYFSTDSNTVGSIWSHNAPLNTKREFGDAVGYSNSALFIGGVTGHSTPLTAVGATTCCVEEYNGLTWSSTMRTNASEGYDASPYYGHLGTFQAAPSANTYQAGFLGGTSPSGIWQLTATGCSADSATVHGGACKVYSNNNLETPGAAMIGVAKEFDGVNWYDAATMSNPRVGMAGAGSQHSALVFGGGYHCARTIASMESLACTEEYNGIGTAAYSAGGAMVETVCQGAGAGTQNSALAFGGCCQVGSTQTGYSDISQEYDGSVWSSNASLNNPRWKPAGAGTQNSAIAIGGYCRLNSDSTGVHSCVEEYDGSAWTNRSAITIASCDAAVGGSANSAHSFGSGTYSAKYETNVEVNRSSNIVVNRASGGVTVGMWVRFPYSDPTGGGNEFANKTYLFANADIDSSTSGTFNDRDGDTMKGRAGLRLLRHNGKLRLEWSNFVGSANEADTTFDSDGNNLITSFWASNDGNLFNNTDWYHVVAMTDFSRSATVNKMFINGSQISITAGVDNKTGGGLYDYEEIIYPNNHTARISIGAWNGQVYSFDVAQLMYHDRLLEPVEIYRTYQSFKNRIK